MDIAVRRVMAQGRRLLLMQSLLTAVLASGAYLYNREAALAWGVLYGGGISILSSALLGLGVGWAASGTGQTRQWLLYGGAAVRFVMVLVLFAIGLGGIGLAPMPVVVGFIAAQLVFPFAARKKAAQGT